MKRDFMFEIMNKSKTARVKCEKCPLEDFCLCQTMATCPLLKLFYKSMRRSNKNNES